MSRHMLWSSAKSLWVIAKRMLKFMSLITKRKRVTQITEHCGMPFIRCGVLKVIPVQTVRDLFVRKFWKNVRRFSQGISF